MLGVVRGKEPRGPRSRRVRHKAARGEVKDVHRALGPQGGGPLAEGHIRGDTQAAESLRSSTMQGQTHHIVVVIIGPDGQFS